MNKRPFLDYYIKNAISPVSQDISNMTTHLRRRNALYMQLGIVPNFLSGKSVLEFGPGSGYNSIHTLHLSPARYLLVDGNHVGLERTKAFLYPQRDQQSTQTDIEFVHADFLHFQSEERFDVVLCEGFLPLQLDPCGMLRHLASFAKKGGIVVCTCIDPVSFLPDLLRRVIGQALVPSDIPINDQVEKLVPLFAPHFATLPNMSRPVDDWILDNMLHPYFGKLMSMHDAVEALEATFDVYGCSPNILNDWRWYKDIIDIHSGSNELFKKIYTRNIHNLLDHSIVFPERDDHENVSLYAYAEQFVKHCFAFYENRDKTLLYAMSESVRLMADNLITLGDSATLTRGKMCCGASALEQVAQAQCPPSFGSFISLFGRAQQYLSFIRPFDS